MISYIFYLNVEHVVYNHDILVSPSVPSWQRVIKNDARYMFSNMKVKR